jgi:hypothetical protein
MYMEISQVNSLCSYLYHKQAKTPFFFLLFSSTRIEGQDGSCTGLRGGLVPVGVRRWQGKGVGE